MVFHRTISENSAQVLCNVFSNITLKSVGMDAIWGIPEKNILPSCRTGFVSLWHWPVLPKGRYTAWAAAAVVRSLPFLWWVVPFLGSRCFILLETPLFHNLPHAFQDTSNCLFLPFSQQHGGSFNAPS
jgi:hypothetical protein